MIDFLTEHSNIEKASFHMPGHKGSALFARLGYEGITADHDITEIPGADDLRRPEGIIKVLTDRYASLYGSSKAFISVNGSSALIMAAIMTCVKAGHKLLAAADSHISVKNGAVFAGAEIVYAPVDKVAPYGSGLGEHVVKVQRSAVSASRGSCLSASGGMLTAPGSVIGDVAGNGGYSMPCGVSAGTVAKALDADPDIDAVILPSPNYFGIVSDIKAIAEEVHKRGKILIVDQAHGAHLKMFANAGYGGKMPAPAEECGADIVIVSTHKTMASFTQTAVANIFDNGSSVERDLGSDVERDLGSDVERDLSNGVESDNGSSVERELGGLVDADEYEKNLLLLESTSPSYILMESLAVNSDIMERHGDELAASWREDLDWFYANAETIPAIRVLTRGLVKNAAIKPASGVKNGVEKLGLGDCKLLPDEDRDIRTAGADFDDSKIVIDFSGIMLDGEEAEEILIEKGIYPEFHAGPVVMCLTGVGNVRKDYELLLDALAEMAWRDPASDWK